MVAINFDIEFHKFLGLRDYNEQKMGQPSGTHQNIGWTKFHISNESINRVVVQNIQRSPAVLRWQKHTSCYQ